MDRIWLGVVVLLGSLGPLSRAEVLGGQLSTPTTKFESLQYFEPVYVSDVKPDTVVKAKASPGALESVRLLVLYAGGGDTLGQSFRRHWDAKLGGNVVAFFDRYSPVHPHDDLGLSGMIEYLWTPTIPKSPRGYQEGYSEDQSLFVRQDASGTWFFKITAHVTATRSSGSQGSGFGVKVSDVRVKRQLE